MRFALLGDHLDGMDMARALVASGRHELATYTGSSTGGEILKRWGLAFKPIGDLEEVLADPSIEAVIVAGRPDVRPAQLRRALQSERHVLCVHPADQTPDIAYEAAMIQGDTRCILLPLLPEALHPGVLRLAELAQSDQGPLGALRLVEMELCTADCVPIHGPPHKPSLQGWDILRALGGEIAEVSAFTAGEELTLDQPVLLTGRFEGRGIFQASYLPGQPEARRRLAVVGSYGRAELVFPTGWPGPSRLTWPDDQGALREKTWETWNPWPVMVEVFEAVASGQRSPPVAAGLSLRLPQAAFLDTAISAPRPLSAVHCPLTWQTAVRCLELDDAARRSVQRRRVSAVEYPEVSDEVGFKGTMTLVGCSVLWIILFLLILSVWVPRAGWAVIPVLALFLISQVLRWVIPSSRKPGQRREGPGGVA